MSETLLNYFQENSLENLASARRIKLNLPRSKDCKKEMTLFLFSLIQAMFVYCSWKLEDMELNDEGEDHISFSKLISSLIFI